ncbi:universal stress protein [Vibrio sp. JC009]|uniref:universal stress protein n=1 Tax=Vibrio sp. JC009 TaxID=2912314 RepID=UPI0023AE9099|nr:universal stress protein [Vibrio sp. JC009]WED24836.1 universal stress protein [Vibrio sp. JC009]
MSYKHILVALDPSENTKLLIEKAVMIAKATDAELSMLCADEVYRLDHYNMVGLTPARAKIDKEEATDLVEKMEALAEIADYPIKNVLVGDKSISEEIEKAIKEEGVDLVVCCHHHDFWHSLFSTAADLMKSVDVDLFVVSLK